MKPGIFFSSVAADLAPRLVLSVREAVKKCAKNMKLFVFFPVGKFLCTRVAHQSPNGYGHTQVGEEKIRMQTIKGL